MIPAHAVLAAIDDGAVLPFEAAEAGPEPGDGDGAGEFGPGEFRTRSSGGGDEPPPTWAPRAPRRRERGGRDWTTVTWARDTGRCSR